MTSAARRQVIVVDDNPRDIELFTTACEMGGIDVAVTSFTDGRSAIEGMKKLVPTIEGDIPDTVVLDLNMPGVTGFDVLRFVKSLDALRATRVLILTTSNSPKDRERCEVMGADGYLVKPPSFTGFIDMLKGALTGTRT